MGVKRYLNDINECRLKLKNRITEGRKKEVKKKTFKMTHKRKPNVLDYKIGHTLFLSLCHDFAV